MAQSDIIVPLQHADHPPIVRRISAQDLKDVLTRGFDDFKTMPTHVIFLCLIYPIVGIVLARATFGLELVPLLYPLAAGFALIGPFAAIGLYELSRRREMGLDTSWKHAFDILHSPSIWSLAALGLLLVAIFCIWVVLAHALATTYLGSEPHTSLTDFARTVLTTPEGHSLIVVGNLVGLVLAVIAFSVSVVSFPLLLDRNVGFATAVITSIRVVLANPVTMALWAVIVTVGLVIGSLPLFCGLAIVMPILGHATWHLYRRVIEPDDSPRPAYQAKPRGRHYAAEFPASLFVASRHRDPALEQDRDEASSGRS